MSLVCPWAVPGFLWGFVICVWDASWYIVVCLLCASWWILGAFGTSAYASWLPLWGTVVWLLCVSWWILGAFGASSHASWVPLGSSSYASFVCLLAGPGGLLTLRHIRHVCQLIHRRMSLVCPHGWALYDTVASPGKSRVPLGTPFYVSCAPLGGAWAPTGLRHMRLGCLLGHGRMSLVCLSVGPGCLCGVVICVLGASWHIVVCLVCASWWVLGFSGLCHLRLGGLLVHRRMSLVCPLLCPGCLLASSGKL